MFLKFFFGHGAPFYTIVQKQFCALGIILFLFLCCPSQSNSIVQRRAVNGIKLALCAFTIKLITYYVIWADGKALHLKELFYKRCAWVCG